MHPELQAVIDELEAASARLRDLQARASDEQWTRRPGPHRWSIGECIAHLNLTSAAYVPLLRSALDEARYSGYRAPRRYRLDPIGWLLWKGISYPGKMKSKTSAPFVPSGEQPKGQTSAEFERLQAQILALAREADGLPLHRVKIASPFDSRVRYNLFSALAIFARHQHRHLWQAERNITAHCPPPTAHC